VWKGPRFGLPKQSMLNPKPQDMKPWIPLGAWPQIYHHPWGNSKWQFFVTNMYENHDKPLEFKVPLFSDRTGVIKELWCPKWWNHREDLRENPPLRPWFSHEMWGLPHVSWKAT
jgi:hypothetical protein